MIWQSRQLKSCPFQNLFDILYHFSCDFSFTDLKMRLDVCPGCLLLLSWFTVILPSVNLMVCYSLVKERIKVNRWKERTFWLISVSREESKGSETCRKRRHLKKWVLRTRGMEEDQHQKRLKGAKIRGKWVSVLDHLSCLLCLKERLTNDNRYDRREARVWFFRW